MKPALCTTLSLPVRIFFRGVCFGLIATVAQAQIIAPGGSLSAPPSSIDASRIGFGIALQRALPRGASRGNVGAGNGLAAYISYNLDSAGSFALRAEFATFSGNESRNDYRVPTGDIEYIRRATVLASSNASSAGVGAQFSRRLGFLRPNLTLSYNRLKFASTSYVSHVSMQDVIYEASNSDISHAWTAGAGIDISLDKGSLAILDVGARYIFGGEGSWLHGGDIVQTGADSYRVNPSRGDMQFLALAAGVRLDLVRLLQR